MALSEEGNGGIPATMLVSPSSVGTTAPAMPYPYPVYGGMGGGSGSGMSNGWGDGAWIILLIIVLLAAGGGWGNNGNGGGGFGSQPIIVNDGAGNSVQRGFDQAAVMSGIMGINNGAQGLSTQLCNCCGDISTQLCNGFAGVNATVTGGVNTLAQQMYSNTIADLERSFASQTATTQGMTGIQSQLAQCCCDNRLATESLRATILQENCADRYEAVNNTRDIIENANRNNQAILDKLCALELDGYKRENDNLRQQLTAANLSASQVAQTAQLRAGQNEAVDSLYNRLSTCPVPTMPVYGSQPIFTCPTNNNGCGCGCNGGF